MNPEEQRTSCPGFLDEYGIWNNGFECPSLSDQIRICCGTESHRYCCPLVSSEKSFLSPNQTTLSFFKKLHSIFLTFPIQFTIILIIILLLLLSLILLFICYRYNKVKNRLLNEDDSSTKQTPIIDHFPFSPPHHKLFFNENNHQQLKDTLTTSISTSSARIQSGIYFDDWKEQPINIQYPRLSTYDNDINNYRYNRKYQQDDIVV